MSEENGNLIFSINNIEKNLFINKIEYFLLLKKKKTKNIDNK